MRNGIKQYLTAAPRCSLVLAGFLLVATGCVQTGDVQPMRTESGREQAKQAYIELGKGYLREGLTGQAKTPLQSALKIDPSDAEAHEVLALVFQQEMEPELAEKHFRKALSSQRSARILNNYGSFLFEEGAYEKALEIYQEAAQDTMYPSRSWVFENMGLTALKMGNDSEAMHYFERALRLDATQQRSLLEMGMLSYELRDYPAARHYYEAYMQQAEHNARSLLLGARVANVYQDRDEAASLGLRLKQLYPASPEYKAYLLEQR